MMHDFLATHRDNLVARCKAKVATRPERHASEAQLANGVPQFLEQLTRVLAAERANEAGESLRISGPSGGSPPSTTEIGVSAAAHGKALLALGYTVDQVVHDYGDLCQAITELAFERDAPFSVNEFKTLNRCLDNAIADAVTEFSRQRDAVRSSAYAAEADERLGFLLHELRNALHTGGLAVVAMEKGNLPVAGATGAVLKRSLASMKSLMTGAIEELRAAHSAPVPRTVFPLGEFIQEVCVEAQLQAQVRGCTLEVAAVDPALQVDSNPEIVRGALANLLGNAFKFTLRDTEVQLQAYAADGHIRIDVADRCGGLPANYQETLFRSFSQLGRDRSGLGLGLSVSRQKLERIGASLTVENKPGVGCVFTIGLPMGMADRPAWAEPA